VFVGNVTMIFNTRLDDIVSSSIKKTHH